MNDALLRDLGAFERRELSRAEMLVRHGQQAAAPLAVHDRLRGLATPTDVDIDAVWLRVAAEIAAPPTVVALRPRARRPRSVVLAAAAALMLAGSAFAVVGPRLLRGDVAVIPVAGGGTSVVPASGGDSPRGGGHPAIVRDGGDAAGGGHETSGTTDGSAPGTPGTDEGSGSGSGSGDGQTVPEDPNDQDQGTGNDGQHDDHGGGNDGHEGGGAKHGGDKSKGAL